MRIEPARRLHRALVAPLVLAHPGLVRESLEPSPHLRRLEVEPDAFQPFARAASEYLQAIAEHRRASSAHAVATVRFATAHGWPRVPETEEQAR